MLADVVVVVVVVVVAVAALAAEVFVGVLGTDGVLLLLPLLLAEEGCGEAGVLSLILFFVSFRFLT